MKFLRVVKMLAVRIFKNVERKHLSLLAAGLAYYFIMSLFPALVLLTAIVAYLPIQGGSEGVNQFLGHLIPPQAAELLAQLPAAITQHRTGLLSFGIITTLWLSSVGVKGVIAGLDLVYEVREPRHLWTNRFLAFGLAFAVGILLLLGVVLTVAGPILASILARVVPPQSWAIRFWSYLQWIPAAISIFSAIELLYLLAPNVPFQRRVTIPGALAAATSWLVLAWGLGFYFQRFGGGLGRTYEFLATPVTLMVWLYWSAFAILLGAEINASLQVLKSSGDSVQEDTLPPRQMDAA